MTEVESSEKQLGHPDNVKPFRSSDQITQEKIATREQLIEKLYGLFSEASERGSKPTGKPGLRAKQKWFGICATLAQTLARLLSDLEYEKMRLEVDELKKMVLQTNVANQRIPFSSTGHRMDQEKRSEQKT